MLTCGGPVAQADEVVNTLDYFLATEADALKGNHRQSQTRDGNNGYTVKWSGTR